MPENPLLPNNQLRALHTLLSQAVAETRTLPRPRRSKPGADPSRAVVPPLHREALLAGALVQLCTGDVLVTGAEDALAIALLGKHISASAQTVSSLSLSADSSSLALSAALSQVLQQAGKGHLTLIVTRSGHDEPNWSNVLASAEAAKLPLIVVCAEPEGAESFRVLPQPARSASLNWTSLQNTMKRAKLPVLSVDGEDGVAVYRVVQESILRARSGGGPAVIWAMLPTQAEAKGRPKAALPLQRLERYLQTRQISL